MDKSLNYRLVFFVVIILIVMTWELFFPKRKLSIGRSRWFGNMSITSINAIITGFVIPILPVPMAVISAHNGWGIMNRIILPEWAAIIIGIIVLDMVIYFQHAMFHAIPVLWRLHMMHHSDLDIDVTTGLRFHPVEIMISMAIKLGTIVLLGVPAQGVLAFEIILNCMAMFNHGNIILPERLDRLLRLAVVTPDMHRVHHSVIINETNSNFGFNLSLWDYLFGTYKNQPAAGHDKMVIGVSHLRELKWKNPLRMLMLPFTADTGSYPLGRNGRIVKK